MKKKKWISLLTGAAVCAVLLSGCQSVGTVGSQPQNPAALESSSTKESSVPVSSAAESSAFPASSEAEAEVLELGTEGTLKDWSITATGMSTTDSVSESEYSAFHPKDGNLYVMAEVTVKNQGKQADSFLPSLSYGDYVNTKLLYGDGYEFSSTNLLGYSKDLHSSYLNPLTSVDGEIAFELPVEVADSSEPLVLIFTAGEEKISFQLR